MKCWTFLFLVGLCMSIVFRLLGMILLRLQRTWAELLCFACACPQLSWRRLVLRKWLNVAADDSDYSADTDSESDSEQEICASPREPNPRVDEVQVDADNDSLPKHTRQKSETFQSQYTFSKEIKICAATWNVGGRVPPDDLLLDDWLKIDDPADIYVIGFQEIIPLNAGNIFGAEDSEPVSKWESKIRESLSRIPPLPKFKCFSDSPSEDAPYIEDEIALNSEELIENSHEESELFELHPPDHLKSSEAKMVQQQLSYNKVMNKHGQIKTVSEESSICKVPKTVNGKEIICLSWPEPLHLLDQFSSERSSLLEFDALTETHNESLVQQKRRSRGYIRIVSKQMVGIFVTVWACRCLRRHIKNLRVSTVGVGIMGYIGNKGSIAVSMSVHQTSLCFICSHLNSGEKDEDAIKRNADALEIHRQTYFSSSDDIRLPNTIYDHEKIFWLGDLNYRINLSYEETRELVSKMDWSKLLKHDQLKNELDKGGVFHGWYEGNPNFPPTYKYIVDSNIYHQGDRKAVRRTPAWCDRILSYGTGIKLLRYTRSEHTLSDHKPVSAAYTVKAML